MLAARLGRTYPSETLETIWKEVLLYQFHDILPGSSIKRVYDESLVRYKELLSNTEAMIAETYRYLADHISHDAKASPGIVVFNSLPWERRERLRAHGRWHHVVVPSMGYTVISNDADAGAEDEVASGIEMLLETPEAELDLTVSERSLENDKLIVKFDQNGGILSILDKAEAREVIQQGRSGNDLRVYHDDGDAWDFRHDYSANPGKPLNLLHIQELRDGPRIGLVFEYAYGESTLTQTVVLTQSSRRIDFETDVD